MFKRECVGSSDENKSSDVLEVHDASLRPRPSESMMHVEKHKEAAFLKRPKGKGRVKNACKRVFLGDDGSSSEDEPAVAFETWCSSSVEEVGWETGPAACNEEVSHVVVKIEEDAEPENSWGRPLTSDDLSTESSDAETASCSSGGAARPGVPTRRADMVLKLRKVRYSRGHRSHLPHYQRVTEHPESQDVARDGRGRRKKSRRSSRYRMPSAPSDDLPPEVCGSQHCSCIPGRWASKHRRRQVLRSAVRDARRFTMTNYPDLVGKRIRHLYEENDKTEVWYRGVVLRIHEPHPDPLKTVFEVKYDSEPEWQYYLELLVDYKKGWLKIED